MKKRLDVLLVEKGLFESRERARKNIMAGRVFVNGQKQDKAGDMVLEDARLEVKEDVIPYVSRGGLKLEKAMEKYGITLEAKACMDIGASTGGFTDCMLQNHASKVYSVDVGYGQLAWKLRQDPKVVCMERTNIRNLPFEELEGPLDFVSVDVSFISLRLVLPKVKEFLRDLGEAVILIKPQFEAGRHEVGKNGVVRDKNVHKRVIKEITDFAAQLGFMVKGIDYSPIKGPKGNIEFLAYIQKSTEEVVVDIEKDIDNLVEKAHGEL